MDGSTTRHDSHKSLVAHQHLIRILRTHQTVHPREARIRHSTSVGGVSQTIFQDATPAGEFAYLCSRLAHLLYIFQSMPDDMLPRVAEIVHHMQKRQYQRANDAYLRLSIGNAPWPIGVTMVGWVHHPGALAPPTKAFQNSRTLSTRKDLDRSSSPRAQRRSQPEVHPES